MKVTRLKGSLAVSVLVLALAVTAGAYATSSANSASSDQVTLGIIAFCQTDTTGNLATTEMKRIAQALGWNVDYQDANPCGDDGSANSLMKLMVLKHDTLIITIAFDPRKLTAGLAAAQAAHIPVIAHAGAALAPGVAWGTSLGYVAAMGQKIAADFGGHFTPGGKPTGKAKGDILNITFHGATPGIGRDQLMKDVAKQNPGLHLTNQEVNIASPVLSAKSITTAWLASHPRKAGVKLGIHAIYDAPATGAVAALKQAGRRDVRVYSYDATPQGLALLKQGWIIADNGNPPLAQAKQTMTAAMQVVSGILGPPVLVPATSVLVTKANVASYEKQYPSVP